MNEEMRKVLTEGLRGITHIDDITPYQLGAYIRENMGELYNSLLAYIEIDLWFTLLINIGMVATFLFLGIKITKWFFKEKSEIWEYTSILIGILVSVYFGSEALNSTKKLIQFKVAPEVYIGVKAYEFIQENKEAIRNKDGNNQQS